MQDYSIPNIGALVAMQNDFKNRIKESYERVSKTEVLIEDTRNSNEAIVEISHHTIELLLLQKHQIKNLSNEEALY